MKHVKEAQHRQKTALEHLNSVITATVSHISDFTKHPGDFTRDRKLNASTTIKVTLNMEGQSLNTEMIHAFPDMNDRMTTSAYEQQKAKLSPELFMHLFREYNQTPYRHNLYNGKYELFATDGSDFNIPYQSKSKYAMKAPTGRPKKNGEPVKPFSQLHGNLLFNITDRTYQDVVIQPKAACDERGAAIEMFERLNPTHPYIILMDRGYDGFNMIEHCNRLNGDGYYVIRTKTGAGGIKEISELPDKECDVEMTFRVTTSNHYYNTHPEEKLHLVKHINHTYKKYHSPNTKNQRWDFKQFENVKCRVVKFQINDPESGKQVWEVLVTNLNRFEFPIKKMKELYHIIWDIETSFRELKYALGAVQFHSRKDDFVEMELIAHLIMFNVVSRTINAVPVPQSTRQKHKRVVSFKDEVTLVRKYFRLHAYEPPARIYAELLGYTRPAVSGRADKRNMKPKSAVWFVYRVA
ncbi:MAG: IS4 family transposase [Lachnospiraceae bacterium]|nr:IS4 family transposase [Lachnospiraceae bacterium]